MGLVEAELHIEDFYQVLFWVGSGLLSKTKMASFHCKTKRSNMTREKSGGSILPFHLFIRVNITY